MISDAFHFHCGSDSLTPKLVVKLNTSVAQGKKLTKQRVSLYPTGNTVYTFLETEIPTYTTSSCNTDAQTTSTGDF